MGLVNFDFKHMNTICMEDGTEGDFTIPEAKKLSHGAELKSINSIRSTDAKLVFPVANSIYLSYIGNIKRANLVSFADPSNNQEPTNGILATVNFPPLDPSMNSRLFDIIVCRNGEDLRKIWISGYEGSYSEEEPLEVTLGTLISLATLLDAVLISDTKQANQPRKSYKSLILPRNSKDSTTYTIGNYFERMLAVTSYDLYKWAQDNGIDEGHVNNQINIDSSEFPRVLGDHPADFSNVFTSKEEFEKFSTAISGNSKIKIVKRSKLKIPPSKFKGPQWEELFTAIAEGARILLTGPTGTGKTMLVDCLIEATNYTMTRIEGIEGIEDRDIIGTFTKVPPTESHPVDIEWIDGDLAEAFRIAGSLDSSTGMKHVLFIDEITRIPVQQQNILVSLMNIKPDGCYHLKLRGKLDNKTGREEILKVPVENLIIIAARNIGIQYAVNSQDRALERRFTSKLEFEYLPQVGLSELIVEITKCSKQLSDAISGLAVKTRVLANSDDILAPLDDASAIELARKCYYRAKHLEIAMDRSMVWNIAMNSFVPSSAQRASTGEIEENQIKLLKDAWIQSCQEAKFSEEACQ